MVLGPCDGPPRAARARVVLVKRVVVGAREGREWPQDAHGAAAGSVRPPGS